METEEIEVEVTCPHCRERFAIAVEAEAPTEVAANAGTTKPMRFYKLAEVQEILDVSRVTLKRWIYDGKLKAVKFGSKKKGTPWRVSAEELERFRREERAS